MKKLCLLLFTVMLFASCSSDDDAVATTSVQNRATFRINGEPVLIENFEEADLKNSSNQKIGKVVHGYNTYEDEKLFKKYQLYMYLEGPNEVGNYHINGIEVYIPDAEGTYTSTSFRNWPENTPQLSMEYDLRFPPNRVKGTFSAELSSSVDEATLTDGIIEYTFEKK
jgi:hypothetical protein